MGFGQEISDKSARSDLPPGFFLQMGLATASFMRRCKSMIGVFCTEHSRLYRAFARRR